MLQGNSFLVKLGSWQYCAVVTNFELEVKARKFLKLISLNFEGPILKNIMYIQISSLKQTCTYKVQETWVDRPNLTALHPFLVHISCVFWEHQSGCLLHLVGKNIMTSRKIIF